jgi:hypothetical protein
MGTVGRDGGGISSGTPVTEIVEAVELRREFYVLLEALATM